MDVENVAANASPETTPTPEPHPEPPSSPTPEIAQPELDTYAKMVQEHRFMALIMRLCESPNPRTQENAFTILTRMASHPDVAMQMATW